MQIRRANSQTKGVNYIQIPRDEHTDTKKTGIQVHGANKQTQGETYVQNPWNEHTDTKGVMMKLKCQKRMENLVSGRHFEQFLWKG